MFQLLVLSSYGLTNHILVKVLCMLKVSSWIVVKNVYQSACVTINETTVNTSYIKTGYLTT